MKSISVQFSGAAAVYTYLLGEHDQSVAVSNRVVVPTKMKTDGTVTLTIATVIAVHEDIVAGAEKPIIAVLSPGRILWATSEVKRLESVVAA